MIDIDREIASNIARTGLHIMAIMSGENEPGFGYTIGLTETFGHPELIMFGLPHKYYMQFFNEIAGKIRAGKRLVDGTIIDDLANMPMIAKTIPAPVAESYAFQTKFHYEGTPYTPAYQQLVMPDRNRLFPWDEGYDLTMRKRQPDLWQHIQ